MGFMEMMEKNVTRNTENGAIGFATEGHKLVDLNFEVPSFRDGIDAELFEESFAQDERLTLKWLLYLRDIRQGIGERKSFRDFVVHLVQMDEETAFRFIASCSFEEYGRWDDYIDIYFRLDSKKIRKVIENKIVKQFKEDVSNFHDGKPVSLLVKWLPSINTSSSKTRDMAKKMVHILGLGNQKHYRKILSAIRKHIDIVEKKMSANEWHEINYEHVPSKANLIYADAFIRHDEKRRKDYLDALKNGEAKINAEALFLHDIVHKYKSGWIIKDFDVALEQMWKSQEKVDGFCDTVVVRDGSGSMGCTIGNTNVTAITVADAITLYCAENNSGGFKDKFITFSSKAKIVDVSTKNSLRAKLVRLAKEHDCSNTNIENVFNLILNTAVSNKLTQEEMPKTVLIVSDMEFDCVTYDFRKRHFNQKALFEKIASEYQEHGYDLPKLVFWNVNSRTNVIPIQQNKNGVILLSGFSKNLMSMVMSSELDPYKALVNELESERYSVVDKIY